MTREGRPLPYWIMLTTVLIGGAMLSVLMVLATIAAAGAGENGYALAFGSMAGACIVLPPLIVGLVMEKMWQLDRQHHAREAGHDRRTRPQQPREHDARGR